MQTLRKYREGDNLKGKYYLEYFYYDSVEDDMKTCVKYVANNALELVAMCIDRHFPLLEEGEDAAKGFRIKFGE